MYIHPPESVLSSPVSFTLVPVFCLHSHLSLTSFSLHSFAVAKRSSLGRHVVKAQLVGDGVWAAVLLSPDSEYCSKHSVPAVASVFPHTHTHLLLMSSVWCLSSVDQQREPGSFSVGTAPYLYFIF